MKPRYTMGLTLLTGIAIGALALQGLHAQSKPPIYVVAEIDVSNQDAYVKEYAPLARAAIKAGGGKLIAVSSNVTSIEGTPQKSRVAIQEWESMEKFKERKQHGEIPSNASPGGGIGIHGTFPHEDFVIDRYKNWTNGCISLKREDIEDLYSYIPIGTQVTIRK